MTLVTNLYQRRIPVGPSIHVIQPSRPRSSCHPERRAFRSEVEGSPTRNPRSPCHPERRAFRPEVEGSPCRSESRPSRGLHFERETLRLASLAQGDMMGNWLAQGDKVGGSLMELDTQLQIATNLGYLDHEASTDLANQLQTVFAPLSGLIITITKRIAQHSH
jgi:hypothetical protein